MQMGKAKRKCDILVEIFKWKGRKNGKQFCKQ